jgi:hypothetical protein
VYGSVDEQFARLCEGELLEERTNLMRACFVSDNQIASFLSSKITRGSMVYLVAKVSLEAFPATCSEFKCIDKQRIFGDLGSPKYQKAFQYTVSSEYVDFLISAQAQRFFGNAYTPFSRHIHAVFSDVGKPAEFFNSQCPKNITQC